MASSRMRLVAAALTAALVVGACSSGSDVAEPQETDSSRTTNGTLVVANVASLTGSAADYGIGQTRGIELAVDLEAVDLAFDVELRTADDASDAAVGAEAFTALIEEGVAAILGPTLSPVAARTDPLAQAVGVPVLAVTNTTLDIAAIGDVVWRITLSEQAMLPQTLANARATQGVTTAALIGDSTDDYSRGAADAFRAGATEVGVEVIAASGFDPATLDDDGYDTLITDAVASGADAILLAARSTPATRLLTAAQRVGASAVLIGSNGFNAPEVLTAAGSAADGLTVTASWNPAIEEPMSEAFVTAFRERFGTDPDAFAAQGYAGVQVLLAAAEAGDGTSRQAILNGLRSLDTVETVVGTVRFVDREASYPAAIQQVIDGRLGLVARGTP